MDNPFHKQNCCRKTEAKTIVYEMSIISKNGLIAMLCKKDHNRIFRSLGKNYSQLSVVSGFAPHGRFPILSVEE